MKKELYKKGCADYPRLKTDKFFIDHENVYSYKGFMDDIFHFIEDFQLTDSSLWERFVLQFREGTDSDAGWRGEYWGKMMRGACFVYSYTRSEKLYNILARTVSDMVDSAGKGGRISSYPIDSEFDGWDIWCRKYVLLGMQYFLEICRDENFARRIVDSMCAQMDYIMERIGGGEGQIPITSATRHWRGLNSSSLLEPVVRLYSITQNSRYLDFAGYIVSCGGTDVADIFELAYEDDFYPYQYPVTKAYEMISCFEGLLEYYRITGNPKHREAVIRFADKILESDFTVIGGCGCTHELFDHSAVRQANTANGSIAQETCVTVTLMKFFCQLYMLTGSFKYADAFEISMYNAYLGSLNTEKVIEPMILRDFPNAKACPLPFDSYSPLTAGTRGNGIGGLKFMQDNYYYGCCACIGAAGCGLIPKMQFAATRNGLALSLFINGQIRTKAWDGKEILFDISTDYPKNGEVTITLHMEEEEAFELLIRNPGWSENTDLRLNGEKIPDMGGYFKIKRNWKNGDLLKMELDMRTRAIYPTPYGSQILMNKVIWGKNYMVSTFDREDPAACRHIALQRGPVMLAQDSRLGHSVDLPADIRPDNEGYVDVILSENSYTVYPCILQADVVLADGSHMPVTDYASAGKLFNQENKMAVWMLTEREQKQSLKAL